MLQKKAPMKAICFSIPLFILPTLQAAKAPAPALEKPKATKRSKASKRASFNVFQDESFIFSDFRNRSFDVPAANTRPAQFQEAYNPWNEDAARAKAAFDY